MAAGAKDEKAKLTDYVKKILKAAEIPFDPQLGDNGGFVKAPNDVMAFDFAECWNCKKAFAVSLPDPDGDQSGSTTTILDEDFFLDFLFSSMYSFYFFFFIFHSSCDSVNK